MIKLLPALLLSVFTVQSFAQCAPGTAFQNLDVNNVRARLNNGGDMWWDLMGSGGYQVPIDSPTNAMFAGSVWIGGLDANNQLHVAAQTYRLNGVDFFPGPLNSTGTIDSSLCTWFDRMWNVYGIEIDSVIELWNVINSSGGTAQLPVDQIPDGVLYWPANGNPYAVVSSGNRAPFFDRDGDGLYDPTYGDYPILGGCDAPVYADQMVWWVYNDAGNVHGESGGVPLGVEVQALAYAFKSSDCINDQTFYRFKIVNRSGNDYHDVYVGIWLDPHNGCYTDDYIGCDTQSTMGIVYSVNSQDTLCGGDNSVMLGVKILNTLNGDSTQQPMSHLMYYNNDFTATGNPQTPQHYYNYLQSIFKDGTHLTVGGSGYGGTAEINYAFPDDPTLPTGWSECALLNSAADRRMLVSSGPTTLPATKDITLDFALVWVKRPVDTAMVCPSFDLIKQCAAAVQQFYDEQLCANSFVGVNSVEQSPPLKVFPNPASTNEINVVGIQNGLVEIFDLTGKTLLRKQINASEAIVLLNGLVGGCYVMKATFDNSSTRYAKLIVQ